MSIQSLVAQFGPSIQEEVEQTSEKHVHVHKLIEEHDGLTGEDNEFGSVRIPISIPLLQALRDVKGKKDPSFDSIKKVLHDYCKELNLAATSVPVDVLDVFRDFEDEEKELKVH